MVTSCPPTATARERTEYSTPSRATSAPTSAAFRSNSTATSGTCCERTAKPPSLMIPALVCAISTREFPRYSIWSKPIGVMTLTSALTTFVASHSPPMPTSITPISIGCSAKAAKAKAVIASKKLMGFSNFESMKSKYAAISL